jgi:hypothetical protein
LAFFFPFVSHVFWWMHFLHLFDSNSPITERTDNIKCKVCFVK